MQCFWSFPLLVSPVQSHMYRIQKRSRTVPYHGGAELPQRIEGERGVEPSQLPAFSSGTALGTTRQETSRFTPIPAFSLLPWDNTRSMRGRMTYQQAPCILAVVNPSARQLGPSWHGCYHRGTQSRDCSSQEQEGGKKGSWRSWRWSNRRVSNAAACAPPPPLGAVGARRQGLLHWGRRQDGGVWTTMPLKGTKIGSLQRTYCGVLVRPGRKSFSPSTPACRVGKRQETRQQGRVG